MQTWAECDRCGFREVLAGRLVFQDFERIGWFSTMGRPHIVRWKVRNHSICPRCVDLALASLDPVGAGYSGSPSGEE